MHSITFVVNRELFAVTTPNWAAAWMLHGILRTARIRSRLWEHVNKRPHLLA